MNNKILLASRCSDIIVYVQIRFNDKKNNLYGMGLRMRVTEQHKALKDMGLLIRLYIWFSYFFSCYGVLLMLFL